MWSKLLWEGFSRFEGKFRLAQEKFLVADVCDPGRAQLSRLGRLMARACAVLGSCLDWGSLGPTFGRCRRPEGRAAAAAGQGRR